MQTYKKIRKFELNFDKMTALNDYNSVSDTRIKHLIIIIILINIIKCPVLVIVSDPFLQFVFLICEVVHAHH